MLEVLDRDAHAPLLGELNAGVGNEPEVRGDAALREPSQVVVEHRLRARLSGPGHVEHRLVLEQVLATLDRPHLPTRHLRHDPPGKRHEVSAARGGAGSSTSTFRAELGPIFSTPTLSYRAGVPAGAAPRIHVTRSGRAAAAPAATANKAIAAALAAIRCTALEIIRPRRQPALHLWRLRLRPPLSRPSRHRLARPGPAPSRPERTQPAIQRASASPSPGGRGPNRR